MMSRELVLSFYFGAKFFPLMASPQIVRSDRPSVTDMAGLDYEHKVSSMPTVLLT